MYAISNSGIKVPARSELKGKLKQNKKTIAVLPFVNMSADPENEYFSDGITEEILNALARVEMLQVTARTSSFAFKGQNLDVREIGQQLGVAHLLEGSVRKAGNQVRITAQLVSSLDGYHFFSETYDRTLENIFAIQDEIAQKITNRLREHLGEAQHQQPLVKAPTANMEAYETYLKGLYYYEHYEDAAWGKAIVQFQKAIEMQEDFALPHARLGFCYMFQAFGGVMSWVEAREKMTIHINRMVELNPESPEAYWSIFLFQIFVKWDWKAAVETTKQGLEAFPSYPHLYHALSVLYFVQGDLTLGVESLKKGWHLDPLNVEMLFNMGQNDIFSGDYEQALIYLNKVVEMVPDHRPAQEHIGWIAALQQQYEEALAIFEKLEPAQGYRLHRSTCLGWVYFKQGAIEKAEECLQELKMLEEESPDNMGLTLDLATLYTCFENFDLAFYYLEKAIKNKVGDTMMCQIDSFFNPLRSDPRFEKIEALVGDVPSLDFLEIES